MAPGGGGAGALRWLAGEGGGGLRLTVAAIVSVSGSIVALNVCTVPTAANNES
jgi:hypothetical protein